VRRGLGEFAVLAPALDSGFDEGPPIAGGVIGRAAPVGIGIDAVGVLQGDGVDDELAEHIVGAGRDDIEPVDEAGIELGIETLAHEGSQGLDHVGWA